MKTFVVKLLVILPLFKVFAQAQTSSSIVGSIVHEQTGEPIAFANVLAISGDKEYGAVTDDSGFFEMEEVALGRYEIRISFVGYEEVILPNMVVNSGRPLEVNTSLQEVPAVLSEVVVKPLIDKKKTKNDQILVSGRLLSVEEANRYAGGFDDPARLLSAFAGVSSRIGSNGIVIRGNAPKYLQWKMEGVEIPNPNHFADLAAFGGGGLTALSSQVLDNSDFITGSMPSSYHNALSGVFDLTMRKGNSRSHRHQLQIGLIGIDAASEGPLSSRSKSSYLINYRYSTLGLIQSLLPEEAQGINYQDLSFKFSFPSLKKGTLEWWGLGLLDKSGQKAVSEPLDQLYIENLYEQSVRQGMGATGLKYLRFLNNKASKSCVCRWLLRKVRQTLKQINWMLKIR